MVATISARALTARIHFAALAVALSGCGGTEPPARESAASPRAVTPEPGPDPVPTVTLAARRGAGRPTALAVYLNTERTRGFLAIGDGPARWTSRVYPMWTATTGDLDGDGTDEVILGIWSRVKRHDEPEPHRAVWVLGWRDDHLEPLWRGSALARPLVDFSIGDLDGDGVAELAALERSGQRCLLAAYRWNGFGFAGTASAPAPCRTTPSPPAAILSNGKLVLR